MAIAPDSGPSRAEDSFTGFTRHMQMLYGASMAATNAPSSSSSLVPAAPSSVPSLPPTTSATQVLEDPTPSRENPSIKAIRLEAIEAEEESGDTVLFPTRQVLGSRTFVTVVLRSLWTVKGSCSVFPCLTINLLNT